MNIPREITALIGGLEALGVELAHAQATLLDQRARIDTFASREQDTGPISGGDSTSPTEKAALARTAISDRLDEWRDEVNALHLIIRNLRDEARWTSRRNGAPFHIELPPAPRCNVEGREGAIEWSDPTCTNVPSRGPLCDRCAKREWRWRSHHGMPARRDGVFAGDLAS